MVKLRKYNRFFIQIIAAFSVFLLVSCVGNKYYNSKIEGKQIGITGQSGEVKSIDAFVAPYREHINKDLDNILAYSPETLDKSKGEWQTSIGNLMADMTVEMGNPVFLSREKKNIDICILNHGGIRSILPKGNVTTRTAFEIMPFENSLIVVELKGTEIREMANYILKEKKPHPLNGLQIIIDKNTLTVKSLSVNGKPLEDSKSYYVATSDYLSNGGDNMVFFRKAVASYDMNYKLRNLMIDYFKKVDTIPVIINQRIILE
ncbi:5'-nucleotidase/2',3'-cyclic phosphodiesterase-like hydrolase [Flavobacterium saliperosum S13]|uniref:5'-nucleotidase, C-terminal domain n=2 Tax=Flavobacterium saliperosum TaxID=329186 RepID=A0A1G4VFY8_9FLAO|nr:5'-nucleotidase [Flavobacterium saliperosum]ESU25910.1 5'-nucleotidase/2',3'-cyclic phosphodiesterase-like hydrolase [Flavobacterium saliperosum S13]SCX05389.1 5'-nucleotidase, C-terminal domain [Flavobacterium saliperosum]